MTIKEMRASTKMTQKAFAEYLNIPLRTIENWEAEKRTPPEYVVELIKYKIEKENEATKKQISILNEVNEKQREFLETLELEFYLEDGKYFVKADRHYDELGTWEDVIYFLDCQLEPQ